MGQKKYLIKIQDTAKQFLCGEDEFILEAMKRSGCGPIHYGCFGGGCGVCRMRIVSGAYSTQKKMSRAHISENQRRDGIVLICCVKPLGDLVLCVC